MSSSEETEKKTQSRPLQESISERLGKLKTDKRRSQISVLQENLGSVEKALSEGIPRVAIWEALQAEGLTLTFKSFETFLHRLRKKKVASSSSQPSVPITTRQSPAKELSPTQLATHPQTSPSLAPSKPGPVPGPSQAEPDPEIAAFEKSIEHLSVVQQGKKTAEFYQQRNRNKISPLVQRILDKDKNKTPR